MFQGKGEWLVVCVDGKMAAIQHVAEVSAAQVAGKQFPIKGRILLLSHLQFLLIKTQGQPNWMSVSWVEVRSRYRDIILQRDFNCVILHSA
jgi:hypothetical protein